MLLEMSTQQGPELSLDVSTLQRLVLVLDSIREIRSIIPLSIYFEILKHAQCTISPACGYVYQD
jgi:hypothetical protein